MTDKESSLDSGLVVVVFIITREGGVYYINIGAVYNCQGANILKVEMLDH